MCCVYILVVVSIKKIFTAVAMKSRLSVDSSLYLPEPLFSVLLNATVTTIADII